MDERPDTTPHRSTMLVAAAIVAALVAITIGLWVTTNDTRPVRADMEAPQGSMSTEDSRMAAMSVKDERAFIIGMIPHHQEAIASAKVIADHSTRPELQRLARDIDTAQRAEVRTMEGWLRSWYNDDQLAAYEPMMRDGFAQLRGDELDKAFLEDMTAHHMMAVHMAQSLLNTDGGIKHPAVRTLAENVVRTQEAEIAQMQTWYHEWFGGTITHADMMKHMM